MDGTDGTPTLLDSSGRPLARVGVQAHSCPRCGGTKRVASSGFGMPHPICPTCGFEWLGQAFVAEESK